MIEVLRQVVLVVTLCKPMPDAGLPFCVAYQWPVPGVEQCEPKLKELEARYKPLRFYIEGAAHCRTVTLQIEPEPAV